MNLPANVFTHDTFLLSSLRHYEELWIEVVELTKSGEAGERCTFTLDQLSHGFVRCSDFKCRGGGINAIKLASQAITRHLSEQTAGQPADFEAVSETYCIGQSKASGGWCSCHRRYQVKVTGQLRSRFAVGVSGFAQLTA